MIIPILLSLGVLQTAISQRPAAGLKDEPLTLPAIVYPADAKAARIQGTVHLQIAVDGTGQVFGVKALDGPVPLRQAAVDAYSHATYRPLTRDGHPTPAIVNTAVVFNLNELPPSDDQELARRFEPLHAQCQAEARSQAPDALKTCEDVLVLSHHFSPGAELDARADAVNDVVLLLLAAKRYPEASTTADEAITLVTGTNHPHTPAVATAYITRCEARSLAKDYSGAAADCTVAEETLETLVADQAAPDQKTIDRTANFKSQLRETYELHAIVLEKGKRRAEAKRIRAKAALV